MIKTNELIKRILVAIIGVPIIVLLSLYGKILFLLLITGIMIISLGEFHSFTSVKNKILYSIIGIITILLINLDVYSYFGVHVPILLTMMVICIIFVELFSTKNNSLINSSIPLLGTVYILFFTYFIEIRENIFSDIQPYSYGGLFILYIFITLWTFDISAYFLGSIWGKHTLFARISPGKTWEGTIGGIIIALPVAVIINHYMNINLSIYLCLGFSLIVCLTAQLSDLVESMFKRNSHIKDSSKILPGHGGIFDRFDGFYLVAPISYLFIKIFI